METFSMTRIIRKRYDDLTQDEICNILRLIEEYGGLIFHEPHFNLIVQQSFHTELTFWIALSKTGEMIGFCPMHTEKHGILKYSYSSPTHLAVPFGGWIFNTALVTHDELIQGMKYGFNEVGFYFSSIQYPTDTFEHTRLPLKRLVTPIIDLAQSEEEIWTKSLKSSRRNRVRKAQKEGVVVTTYGVDGLDMFLPCMKDLHKKINMQDKPDSFYRNIVDYYAPKNQAKIFIAEKDGKVLSGCLVIGNHRYMHGWEAGIMENMPSIGLYEIMYWYNIVWSKEIGSKYMDFCVLDEENLPQIAFFKLEFTNHIVPFYHIVSSSMSVRILAKLKTILNLHKKNIKMAE
jgi:hypothetical protein